MLDIDDDAMVLLCGKDGMCLPGRYPTPQTVFPKDVREAMRAGKDVEAIVVPHVTPRGVCTYVVHSIRVYA